MSSVLNLNLGTFYDTELNSEGEGPSRGLLRDYESSDGPSFQALVSNNGDYILPDMHKTYTYNTTLTGIAAACSNKWHNVVAFNFYFAVKVTYLQSIIQGVGQNISRVSSESRIVDTFCFSSQEQTECIHFDGHPVSSPQLK